MSKTIFNFNNQFEKFQNVSTQNVPRHLDKKVLADISKKIKLSKIYSLIGMLLIHIFSGAAIIAICPQFGINYFDNFMGLQHIFMKFGEHVCSFMCGSLFMFSSMFFALLLLPKTFKLYLYSIRYFTLCILTLLTIFFFYLFGELGLDINAVIWTCGVLLFGILGLNFMSKNFKST